MSDGLSIGLYTYSTQPRGSVVHCAALADALSARGHAVTVYALAKPGAEAFFRALDAQLVLIACAPAPAGSAALIAQRIAEFARCIRELMPEHDIHHAQDSLAANALLRGRPRHGAVVRTVHHVERFASDSLREYQARSIQEVDAILSVSELTQQDVWRDYGVASQRVHNGVERARFGRASAGSVAQLRRKLGISESEPVIVSFGGIEPRKNTLRLLSAFSALRAQLPARWVIVGGASILDHSAYRDEFERQLALCGEDTRRSVVCTGVLSESEVTATYGLAHVVAAPSLQEGFGLVALEALAAGVPLVASRRAPFTEYLDDGCAWLVDPENCAGLTLALREALQGSPERVRRGLERARGFDWECVAREHEALYRKLAYARPSQQGWSRNRYA
ncbi:MAG TPA: MSMEG_0565 family glycosyltransferase [Polyangiales bacterium]